MKNLPVIAAAVFLAFVFCQGLLKVESYIIGIYTEITVSQADVIDYRRFLETYLERYDDLPASARADFEKERLWREIRALNSLEPFVARLENAEQLNIET